MSHPRMTPILAQWAGALLASAILCQSAWAEDDLVKLQRDPAQWSMQQENYANTRYSLLKQINTSNVQNLKVAWQFSTGVLRGHEGGPLVVGDMMYVHTPFPTRVFAIDLNDPGKIVWIYDGKPDRESMAVACCDVVNRGPNYADGKLFLSLLDGHLVAIDAKTGKERWRV